MICEFTCDNKMKKLKIFYTCIHNTDLYTFFSHSGITHCEWGKCLVEGNNINEGLHCIFNNDHFKYAHSSDFFSCLFLTQQKQDINFLVIICYVKYLHLYMVNSICKYTQYTLKCIEQFFNFFFFIYVKNINTLYTQ